MNTQSIIEALSSEELVRSDGPHQSSRLIQLVHELAIRVHMLESENLRLRQTFENHHMLIARDEEY